MSRLRLPRPATTLTAGIFIVCAGATFVIAPSTVAVAATASMRLTANRSVNVPNERVILTGSAAVAKRSVQLQALRKGRWVRIHSTTAGTRGKFTMTVKATTTHVTYRSFAPTFRPKHHKPYPARLSNKLVVSAVKPRATVSLLPAPIGKAGMTPGRAAFYPARPGRPVSVQHLSRGGWTTVVRGKQTSGGVLDFQVPATSAGSAISYRAQSVPATGTATTTSPAARSANWTTAYRDEFAASTLGTDWRPRAFPAGARRMCSTVPDVRPVPSAGTLPLTVTRKGSASTGCPYGTYTNTMVGTDYHQKFLYGYFAARVKFQSGQGQHGGFWLQSNSPVSPQPAGRPDLNGAEIDTAEYFGDAYRDGGLAHFAHWLGKGPTTAGTLQSVGGVNESAAKVLAKGDSFSKSYHVFSVEWTPSRYVFRVDGVQTFTTTQGVSKNPEFLVLSLLSSDWELHSMKTGAGHTMLVDWVRVFQSH